MRTTSTLPAASTNDGGGGTAAPTREEVEAIIARARANGVLDEPAPSEAPETATGYDFEPGEGAELLDEVLTAVKTYVVLPSVHAYVAVVLWVVCTHALSAFEHATRLAVHSPLKRCGKSRLLEVIEALVYQPLATTDISVSALYRTIEAAGDRPPTLILDEADRLFGSAKKDEENRELIALLNNGFRPGRPTVRCVGPNQTPTPFSNFAMAVIAGIGRKPDTVEDRSINITMRRRLPGEKVAKFRLRSVLPPLHELRDRLAAWAAQHLDALGEPVDDIPDELEDRAEDAWEPLLAVADVGGGDWPKQAREAAKALVAAGEDADADNSLSLRLLADLREVFGDADKLDTATILSRLTMLDDAPWSDLFGKALDSRGLARRLLPYEVKPKTVRIGEKTPKGYERADLADVWRRYLPDPPQHAQQGNNAGQDVADDSVLRIDPQHDSSRNALTRDVDHVAHVADPPPGDAEGAPWPDIFGDDYGPCVKRCGRSTKRYGSNANPLCVDCRTTPEATT